MNEILNRLKNSIDRQILNKVKTAQLEQLKFVPISVKEKFLFVAIGSSITDKEKLNLKLKEIYPFQIKFIQVSDSDLEQLIISVKPMMGAEGAPVNSAAGQAKLGELLIKQGHITDLQLLQALAESKRLKMPIGSTLFKLGFISLQQLKDILHEQTGYEIVTNEHLAKQDKFIGLLPEDFIKANKVVPLSSDGRTLMIGVVSPLKPEVLREVIYITGQNPKQLLMTHYEFQNSMETFFSEQKKETERIIQKIEEESADIEKEESLW
ncbi:hypothetical protein IKU74_05930, partial [bacterium]|nr:hypothetical protein [bacterium]